VVSALVPLGLKKVRLTGGEPLLRQELPELVAMLARLPGLDLALTTNGSLLAKHAQALREAGLGRLTVSLDSVSPEVFTRMTDSELPVSQVLAGIDAAHAAGFGPMKINTVVRRGVNEHSLVQLARHFKGSGDIVRFIEYMDVGLTNGWRMDQVVSGREIVALVAAEMPIEPASSNYRGEVARRYRYLDGSGEIGVITSVTQPFCGDCTRLRLSADGQLFGCLFARSGRDCATVAANAAPPMNPPAAPNPASSRAKLSTAKLPDSAHSASDTTQASVPQRTAAISPYRLMSIDASSAPPR